MINYQIRKLLFVNRHQRNQPVSLEHFSEILESFLQHVRPDFVSVLYERYCKIIHIGCVVDINTVTDLFQLSHSKSTSIQYYIDRGWSVEEARQKVIDRQQTNSISAIMRRKGVMQEEAEQIQRARIQQGHNTSVANCGSLDEFKNKRRQVLKRNIENNIAQYAIEHNISFDKARQEVKRTLTEKASNTKRASDNMVHTNTSIQYYLNQGLTLKEAEEARKQRQRTFSLDICIDRYGVEEGTKIWKARQDKWLATMDGKSDEEKMRILKAKVEGSKFVSQASRNFFSMIIPNIPKELIVYTDDCEYFIRDSEGNFWKYDFTIPDLNIIIEFNGHHVHPKISSPDNWVHAFTKQSKMEVLAHDGKKQKAASERGFDVFYVWNDEDLQQKAVECVEIITNKYREYENDNNTRQIK